ncbi:YDG domain-containing protein At5g47160-like [Argentina anserina]|uniref:YDG domain-containing protein At5g47160-like n=1 Tax=Argentina anserina TaxID=57926 RepID=UPI0021762303|nr:YDG domain-containing protein At5g47160-like [Potentilla anserina]
MTERAGSDKARADRIWATRIWDGKAKIDKPRDEKGSVTPKVKRQSVDDFGIVPKRHGSVRSSEHEDHKALLDHDMSKSSTLRRGKINDDVRHVGIVKVAPRECFPSRHVAMSKADRNTSCQGPMKRQPLSNDYHPDMAGISGSFDVNQHVPCLETRDCSKVKKDLNVFEDTSTKSWKNNWSKEHQHNTNKVNSHFLLGRKSQPLSIHHRLHQTSMLVELATKKSMEVNYKDRSKVKGALRAYKEILTKSITRKCNSCYVKAAMVLKKQGKWVNTRRQVGSIGGVEVGDKFRYRAQLNVVGLHRQYYIGIDQMRRNDGKILAISIVDSGRYANKLQSTDILIYSGQGGKSLFNKTKPTDQTMQGGNLALKNSQEEGTPIRVIRKLKHLNGSCYVYCGIYIVERVSEEKEFSILIYKFRLKRKPGQTELSFDTN